MDRHVEFLYFIVLYFCSLLFVIKQVYITFRHSVDLFIDFIIIFKDLLIILTDKEKKKVGTLQEWEKKENGGGVNFRLIFLTFLKTD